jgi:hypothetical protein
MATVAIHSGYYQLSRTRELAGRDSGGTYRTVPGARARFLGGVVLC